MSSPSAILDYASPRPHGKVRLPSQSRIVVERDRRELTVTETLQGRAAAVGALGVAVLTLLLLAGVTYALVRPMVDRPDRVHPFDVGVVVVVVGLWLTEAVTMVLVVNNTWRRTVLRARDGQLSIEFSAPVSGVRRHAWAYDQVLELHVDRTIVPGFVDARRELAFRAYGGQHVRLFTDHPEHELEAIVRHLREVMDGTAPCSSAEC